MPEVPSSFGAYVLLKSLGTGGGGDVFLAKPRNPRRGVPPAVVIKRLHGNLAQESNFVRRFRHEAEIAVSVASPHLVKCFDAGIVGETFYIAMEYVPGWTLGRMIRELREAKRPASLQSVGDVIAGALKGLDALHSARDPETGEALSIVHRDIAPKNIMVGEDGVTRLIDLGIGKSSLQDWKTGTGVIMGSPGYMAPEQVAGEKVDHRIDIYAMGIVLWEFLTLRMYFERTTFAGLLRAQHKPQFIPPSRLVPELPKVLDDVCARAVAIDREQRYATAAEFLAALRGAIPERDEEQPLATVVGEMLLGELGKSKTEVFGLLSAAPAPTPQVQEVVVLAQREGTEENLLPTLTGPEQDAAAFPTPYSLGPAPMPPQRTGVPIRAVVPLLAITLLLGVGGTALFLQKPNSETVQVIDSSAIVAEPKVVAPPAAIEAKPREVVVQPVEEAPTASRKTKAPVREDSRTIEPERRVEVQAPSGNNDPREAVNALIARVRAVRAKVDAQSDAAKEATRLMTKLSLESARPDLDAAKAANLEAEVRALEAL